MIIMDETFPRSEFDEDELKVASPKTLEVSHKQVRDFVWVLMKEPIDTRSGYPSVLTRKVGSTHLPLQVDSNGIVRVVEDQTKDLVTLDEN